MRGPDRDRARRPPIPRRAQREDDLGGPRAPGPGRVWPARAEPKQVLPARFGDPSAKRTRAPASSWAWRVSSPGSALPGAARLRIIAILAAALGVPAVGGADRGIPERAGRRGPVVDGDSGEVRVAPMQPRSRRRRPVLPSDERARLKSAPGSQGPANTADGDAHRGVRQSRLRGRQPSPRRWPTAIEGCGLLRTEFLFLDSESRAPDEDEHASRLSGHRQGHLAGPR